MFICLLILLFMIQNTILEAIIEYIVENSVFLLLGGFTMEMGFIAFEIWLLGSGKVLEMLLRSWYEP